MQIEDTLPKEQAGFRHNRSCCDQALSIVTHVENGFQERKKSGAVFLDLICTYDTGTLEELEDILNEDLAKVLKFFKSWPLTLIPGKSASVVFHLNNRKATGN